MSISTALCETSREIWEKFSETDRCGRTLARASPRSSNLESEVLTLGDDSCSCNFSLFDELGYTLRLFCFGIAPSLTDVHLDKYNTITGS